MPYADPIAAELYAKQRRDKQRKAMERLRAERRARGEREPESNPPIRRLQNALSEWR